MSSWTRLVAWTHFTRQSQICLGSGRVIHNFWASSRTLRSMMEGKKDSASNINTTSWPAIGICQLTGTEDKEHNFHTCETLIKRAKNKGAQMVFLPEACDFIGQSKSDSVAMAEPLDGSTISRYRSLAKELGVWLSLGGFHQKVSDETDKVFNTHVIIDADGGIQATYNKTHLFDLDIKGKVRLCESDYTIRGREICPPVQTPVGKIGLATCYDLRFPEMSLGLTAQGAEILTYPSAFTVTTGMAHWEVLLRSRAIECQCYVVAAAQTGSHNSKRSSYGHAMIVDPWGAVVAQCHEGTDVCVAELDLDYLRKVRTQMPVAEHRRHDLYGHISVSSRGTIDSQESYQFGKHQIGSKHVFFRSSLSFAFVNIKPVVPGHVLVSPLHLVPRLADLTEAETADLFSTVKKVSGIVQQQYSATSLTVAVQDGPEAGQSVQHIHVHILPRRKGDFSQNDDVYPELEQNERELQVSMDGKRQHVRTAEEMEAEAAQLRSLFT